MKYQNIFAFLSQYSLPKWLPKTVAICGLTAGDARAQVSALPIAYIKASPSKNCRKRVARSPVRLVIQKDKQLQPEGFRIRCKDIQSFSLRPHCRGLLYAAYHLLRLQQTANFPLLGFQHSINGEPGLRSVYVS